MDWRSAKRNDCAIRKRRREEIGRVPFETEKNYTLRDNWRSHRKVDRPVRPGTRKKTRRSTKTASRESEGMEVRRSCESTKRSNAQTKINKKNTWRSWDFVRWNRCATVVFTNSLRGGRGKLPEDTLVGLLSFKIGDNNRVS